MTDKIPESAYSFHGGKYVIPPRMRQSLHLYIHKGYSVGDFLTSIITNDLRSAVAYADDENMENLPAYVNFFYNYAPSVCWGSGEKMIEWIEKHADAREAARQKEESEDE